MLKLLLTSDLNHSSGTVQTGKQVIHLPAKQITTIYVRAHMGAQFAGQSLLFLPLEPSQLPEGLVIQEGLVTVREGRSVHMPVSVANTSKLNLTLARRTILGHLEEIKAVYPVTLESPSQSAETHTSRKSVQLNEVTSTPQPSQNPPQWDPPVHRFSNYGPWTSTGP